MTYYATFAPEHRHPATREPMDGFYIKIDSLDEEGARFAMFSIFQDNWAILYEEKEFSPASCPRGEYASCVSKDFNPIIK